MCLPCFPWSWSKYEDPLDKLDKLPEQSIWVHDGHDWALQRIVSGFFFFFGFVWCSSLLLRSICVSHTEMALGLVHI